MADIREYLRELLKRAIPDRSGEIVNFRELRNLLEVSIDVRTQRKSSTSTHHGAESDDGTHYLSEDKEQTPTSEEEAQKMLSDEEKLSSLSDEMISEASTPKSEIESETIGETEETKHNITPVRSKIVENQAEALKDASKQGSSAKDEEKSSSKVKQPSVRSQKSVKSPRDSHIKPQKVDSTRSSRTQYSKNQASKTEMPKTSKTKPSKTEHSKEDAHKDQSHKKIEPTSPVESMDEKYDSLSEIESPISSGMETPIAPESHTPLTGKESAMTSSGEEGKERETHTSEEASSSSHHIPKNDQKAGASGTTDKKKPPMDGDRKRFYCDDGELLLVVRMPKDLVCNTRDQSEFTFELSEEDFRRGEREKDT
ncbi:HMG box-containing protein 4-like [Sitodiplosis mosellana]|uniref:HMG box-containing protein 4-like n=1 Tax=Sitodiplosis mosellana TaxID=263140 RepID=UPI002444E4A1|nr:HMG box-containing protein 4-like [Sitodiplosis mosellana]